MKKIALTGGRGMLGSDLAEAARAKGLEVIICDLPDFDITNPAAISRAVEPTDVIVNCAAYTNVDKAESERETARRVNALAPGMLGEAARKYGKYVIHISTDFVFGDTKDTPFNEDDAPSPLNVYGESKLEGEQLLAKSGCAHSIIRIQWTYGRYGNNFVRKIVSLAQTNKSLKVVNDQTGSPTHTADVARAILCFVEKQPSGVFHFASGGYATRYESALFFLRELGINTELIPCSSEEFPVPAKRPANSRFDCSKIDTVLDFRRPFWKDSMKEFIGMMKQNAQK